MHTPVPRAALALLAALIITLHAPPHPVSAACWGVSQPHEGVSQPHEGVSQPHEGVSQTPETAALTSCGQVRVSGAQLADDAGIWRPRGVAFFLPQYGINTRTLHDTRYAAAAADGSLDYWLDRARDALGANMLRVFVELPSTRADGSTETPTSFETVYDLAQRAAARGMRVGLVLHNSASWSLTPERAAWVDGLLAHVAARGALPLIAYLSASNEINNYCGGHARDCFDDAPGVDAQPYVDAAVGWVAQLRAAARARAPQVLVTVGISSEMGDADGTRAAFNFFRPDSQGRTLASLVDFLAPHNFGGGAQGIYDDMRFAGYGGPIVLEEFGFPTDPFPRGSLFTEGPPVCRAEPLRPECAGTAPAFVEANLLALQVRPYAGAVAWMLADVSEKNTSGACADPAKPADLWTGLLAIGGAYCDGGTYSRAVGEPKATAVRICLSYTGDIFRCDPARAVRTTLAMPIVSR